MSPAARRVKFKGSLAGSGLLALAGVRLALLASLAYANYRSNSYTLDVKRQKRNSQQNIVNNSIYPLLPDAGNDYKYEETLTNMQDSESDTAPPSSQNTSY